MKRVVLVGAVCVGLLVQADWAASAAPGGVASTTGNAGWSSGFSAMSVMPADDETPPAPEPSPEPSSTSGSSVVGLTQDRFDALLLGAALVVFLLAVHVVSSWAGARRD